MSQRFQAVNVNGILSSWKEVKSGVPQGSVLGPLLFAMIVDDLKPIFSNSTIVKYADDVTLLHFLRRKEEDHLQEEWDNIKSWCASVQLAPNGQKTKVMEIITNKRLGEMKSINENGTQIETVTSARLLGIIISNDMKWGQHIEYVYEKAAKRIFSLVQLRGLGAPSDVLQRYYVATIRSILLYGHPAWCNVTEEQKRKLISIEKRVSKLISNWSLPPLFSVADSSAMKIMKSVIKFRNHPLNITINRREPSVSHIRRDVTSHFAKTTRYKMAFHHYADML
jgi:ribonucleases P/MRP protein subunit RPP40